jgi:hypothetical protein
MLATSHEPVRRFPTVAELRLKERLIDRLSSLVSTLLPGGYMSGGDYIAPDPVHAHKTLGNFHVRMRGAKAGSFVDYAGDHRSFRDGGDRGDVIDLIAYVQCNRSRREAIRWACDWLGIDKEAQDVSSHDERLATARRALAQSEKVSEQARRDRGRRIWHDAARRITGTLGETYFREARKIPLDEITSHTRDLRFARRLKHWTSGEFFPAIVGCLRARDGLITGIHCTFLAPDGSGKAPVDNPKLMLGQVRGSVLRIANGSSRLGAEDAAAAERSGVLALCEGLEDGLTIAAAAPEARVWAATSLGNIGNVPIDHPCVSHVVVAADNDANARAAEQFELAMDQLRRHGKPIAVMRSPIGKDFNDCIKGDAP